MSSNLLLTLASTEDELLIDTGHFCLATGSNRRGKPPGIGAISYNINYWSRSRARRAMVPLETRGREVEGRRDQRRDISSLRWTLVLCSIS